MRVFTLLSTLLAAAAVASAETVSIFLQPITTSNNVPPPALLAEVQYTAPSPTEPPTKPEVTSYEAPDIPDDAKLVRIGIYDSAARAWASSTTVVSVDNFGKGYSPHFVLTVSEGGELLGVSVRGVRIDAGQTRDFGPQAVVVATGRGKQVDLNKPVVLSPEGKKVQEEGEKSFLQKYWWVIAIGAFLLVSGGGDGK
ncbi:hypothetical protein B0H66DRAFT_340214 [Apodospora peruviana]|uniref:Cyclin-dependent protein kinase regulator pho80 n=1 Tax=Apodospora peruviana TaxID=516989 RepID=A0AAE0HZ19_9PEZI|nr:hypothetical protein B0H66DRAFT_340214 [Apodospora peruviana]